MFSSLRYRDYRLYWIGGVISFTGSWVQTTSYGWLTYEITDHSKLWLGLIGAVGSLPMLGLTLFGGAVADRVDRRRAMMLTQGLFAVFAVILGVLVYTGAINRYYILVIAFLQGIVLSLDMPLRQAMPASLVPKENMMNAIVLNSAAFNSARIIGPAIAGILIAKAGMASCFFINAASFLAVIFALILMKTDTNPIAPNDGSTIMADMTAGLRYIRSDRRIYKLMLAVAISSLFVMPYAILMPVFAKDILRTGAQGYGALLSAVGVGAVVGALVLAGLSLMPRRGRIMVISSAFGSLLFIALAASRTMLLSEVILVGIGFSIVAFNQTANSLIQTITSDDFRGRVMSAYVFLFMGLSPFASLQAGALAQAIGAPMTVAIWGIVFLCTSAYLATQHDILNL